MKNAPLSADAKLALLLDRAAIASLAGASARWSSYLGTRVPTGSVNVTAEPSSTWTVETSAATPAAAVGLLASGAVSAG